MQETLKDITQKLSQAKVDSPRLEARIIVGYVLGLEANDVLFANSKVSLEQKEKIYDLLAERLNCKPIDKIIGKKDFYKNSFLVSEDVLSPRPDTEVLVEEAIKHIQNNNATTILDLGTGSGCILLSILDELKDLRGVGLDASAKALAIAKTNAQKLNLIDRVSFINGSWFDDDLSSKLNHKFDLIVSNPPYIPTSDIASLDKDVNVYDPMMALDGGVDGMYHYRQIAKVSSNLLNSKGEIFLESGINQASEVIAIFEDEGFKHIQTLVDLGQIERCVVMQKN